MTTASVVTAEPPRSDRFAAELLVRGVGISKRYGAVAALSDVSFEVYRGEVLGLAGENGSGKSTLVRVLAGVLSADKGYVEVLGHRCSFSTPRDALDAGIALVAQEPTAAAHLSVAENVLAASLRARSSFRRRQLAERAAPFLEAVGLRAHPLRTVETLSQGDRELVEIAKALASQPRLLILDEATTRLHHPDRLFGIVRRLREDGVSTILITHRLREIRAMADRAVVLRDGVVIGELPRTELTDERLSSMMVGRELREFFDKRQPRFGDVALRAEDLAAEGSVARVTFEVREGEVVGLAGLVGAGRTELLETIAGVRSYRFGRVLVGGVAVAPGSVARAMRAGVALVPEDRVEQGLVPGATIRENLAAATLRAFSRIDRSVQRRTAAEILQLLGVKATSVECSAGVLSGGNQQKIVIGRALATSPRVLLLDEPTRGVDVGAKHEIYGVIGDMVDRGMAVLVASSDLLEILGLCDRVLVVFEGAIVEELSRSEASEERIVLLSAGGSQR